MSRQDQEPAQRFKELTPDQSLRLSELLIAARIVFNWDKVHNGWIRITVMRRNDAGDPESIRIDICPPGQLKKEFGSTPVYKDGQKSIVLDEKSAEDQEILANIEPLQGKQIEKAETFIVDGDLKLVVKEK